MTTCRSVLFIASSGLRGGLQSSIGSTPSYTASSTEFWAELQILEFRQLVSGNISAGDTGPYREIGLPCLARERRHE